MVIVSCILVIKCMLSKIIKPSKGGVKIATDILQTGGVVICPTDTVYGFLADVQNKKAVGRIYKIKKRPKSKPLSLFVNDLKMAKDLAEIDERQEKILRKRWPGKYTFILKRKHKTKLYGVAKNTIALRIPKYKFLQGLLKKINKPLVQTSVNISGKPAATKISDIILLLKNCGTSDVPQFLVIDGGDLPKRKPSKVIDLTDGIKKALRY